MIRPIRGNTAEVFICTDSCMRQGKEEAEDNPRGDLGLQRPYRCNGGVKDEAKYNTIQYNKLVQYSKADVKFESVKIL